MTKTDILIATIGGCGTVVALDLWQREPVNIDFLVGAISLCVALIILSFIYERLAWRKR